MFHWNISVIVGLGFRPRAWVRTDGGDDTFYVMPDSEEKPSVNTVCDLMISAYLKHRFLCELYFLTRSVLYRGIIEQILSRGDTVFLELEQMCFYSHLACCIIQTCSVIIETRNILIAFLFLVDTRLLLIGQFWTVLRLLAPLYYSLCTHLDWYLSLYTSSYVFVQREVHQDTHY